MRAFSLLVIILCLQGPFFMSAFAYDEKKLIVKDGVLITPELIAFNKKVLKAMKQTGSKNQVTKASAYADMGDIALNELENFKMARTFFQRAIKSLTGRTSKKSKEVISRSLSGIQTSYIQEFHAVNDLTTPIGTNFYLLPKKKTLLYWEKPSGKSKGTRTLKHEKDMDFVISDVINGFAKQGFTNGPPKYYKLEDLIFTVPNKLNSALHVSFKNGVYSRIYLELEFYDLEHIINLDRIIIYNEIENFLPENLKDQLHDRVDNLFIEHAREKETVEAYKLLIAKSYGNTHHEEAYFRLVELSPSLESCREYRTRYPNGKYSEEVDLAYSSTVNSVESFSAYLVKYPMGKYRNQAQEGLEDSFFSDSEKEDTLESYQRYLDRFPDGHHAKKANIGIEKIHFQLADKNDSIIAFERFLEDHPKGEYASEAHWRIAKKEHELLSYKNFVANYPFSQHRAEVNTLVSYFEAEKNPSVDRFLSFFECWKKKKPSRLSNNDFQKMQERFIEQSEKEQRPEGYVLLFDTTGDKRFLDRAYSLVETKEQEFPVVQRLKDLFFSITRVSDSSHVYNDMTFFGGPIQDLKPELNLQCSSQAKKATYRVTYKITFSVDYYRVWRGILWFKPEGYDKNWTETYSSTVTFIVPPMVNGKLGVSNWETAVFPKFRQYIRTGILLGDDTTGTVVDQSQEITAVEQY